MLVSEKCSRRVPNRRRWHRRLAVSQLLNSAAILAFLLLTLGCSPSTASSGSDVTEEKKNDKKQELELKCQLRRGLDEFYKTRDDESARSVPSKVLKEMMDRARQKESVGPKNRDSGTKLPKADKTAPAIRIGGMEKDSSAT